MKKLNFVKTALIAGLTILAVSCNKDKNETPLSGSKQISAVVNLRTGDSTEFIYNSEGLLTNTNTYTKGISTTYVLSYEDDYGYNNGKLVHIKSTETGSIYRTIDSIIYNAEGQLFQRFEFNYKSGTLFNQDTLTFSYNTDNQLDKIINKTGDITKFTYTNGNITKVEDSDPYNPSVTTHTFDNNINPFQGNPFYFLKEDYFNKNNCLKDESTDQVSSSLATYSYIYDNSGYPVKINYIWDGNNYPQKIYYR